MGRVAATTVGSVTNFFAVNHSLIWITECLIVKFDEKP